MSRIAGGTARPSAAAARVTTSGRLAIALAGSRLVVLAGALVAAAAGRLANDWQLNDPTRLTARLGSLGNVLAGAGVRWDSLHYLAVAAHGYSSASNTVFFPLYPLLIHLLAWPIGSAVLAGLLISAVCFAVWLALVHRLTRQELGGRAADATLLLLAFSPLSLFFTALYSESLFMALSVGAFVLARERRWWRASVAATGAALTHVEGVLLVAPLALMYLQSVPELRTRLRDAGGRRALLRGAVPLLLPALALAGFLLYLRALGYGWLAPSSNERLYRHHFAGPVAGVLRGLLAAAHGFATIVEGGHQSALARSDAFENVLYLAVLAVSLATLRLAWRTLPRAYAIYCGLCLITFVSSPVSGAPLTSLDRYVLVLFPLWMVAGNWLAQRRLVALALTGSSMLLFVFSLQFARWAFVG